MKQLNFKIIYITFCHNATTQLKLLSMMQLIINNKISTTTKESLYKTNHGIYISIGQTSK